MLLRRSGRCLWLWRVRRLAVLASRLSQKVLPRIAPASDVPAVREAVARLAEEHGDWEVQRSAATAGARLDRAELRAAEGQDLADSD